MISLAQRFFNESLFRNSVYLMASTGVLALFGFVFWLINARLFTAEEVGLATTLISAMSLISILSLTGINAAFVRFLTTNTHPNELITGGLLTVTFTSLILSTGFVLAIPFAAEKLLFVQSSWWAATLFITFSMFATLNILTDAVFLAHRRSHFILVINTLFSGLRLALPFALFSLGTLGIFAATGIAQAIGCIISFGALALFFGYRPKQGGISKIREVSRYSFGTYTASVFDLLPATLLPLLITAHIGAAESAYYYMCLMMANLLYVIPYATTRALFAEGSYAEHAFARNRTKAITLIAALILPAIFVLIFFGETVLGFFGADYAAGGTTLLTLFAIAGLAVSIVSLTNVHFLVMKDTSSMIAVSGIGALGTLGASVMLLERGLTGIGIAWIIGNSLAALTGLILYRYPLQLKERYKAISYEAWVRYSCWRRYRRARAEGRPCKTVLFYPDVPKYYYVIYTICHYLGYRMSHDLTKPYDIAFFFKDVTTRDEDAMEKEIKKQAHLINSEARDISKEKVEEVFSDVFGYGMKIDPRTHVGECVRKSNDNATHDGAVVICPREPEPGYIYQKLINNRFGDRVADLRVKVVGNSIPFMMYRTRSAFDRFDNTQTATMVPLNEHLSDDEQKNILAFAQKMGIEFGALDCLRDNDDGRLYIVDANLTTGSPMPGFHLTHEEFEVYVQKFSNAFEQAFARV